MLAVGGFLKNPAIEIEPGKFPIDKAFRTRSQFRRNVPRRRLGEPARGFQPLRKTRFECDDTRSAAIDVARTIAGLGGVF